MNYFEMYTGDYQRDTADLTLVEHGAFLLLLSTYYATERPLPVGDSETQPLTQPLTQQEPGGFPLGYEPVFRIARAMTDSEKRAVMRVADRFFPVSPKDGLRHNARADEEIAKARARIDAARENGRKGGRKPKPR